MSSMPKKNSDKELESDTRVNIRKLLTAHDWFWWNGKADKFGRSGAVDINAFRDGVFMAIEAKRGTTAPKPTALQIAFLNSIRANRGFGFVVNDARLPVLEHFLNAFDRARDTEMYNGTDEGKLAPREIDPAVGSLMLNCIRVMTQELVAKPA